MVTWIDIKISINKYETHVHHFKKTIFSTWLLTDWTSSAVFKNSKEDFPFYYYRCTQSNNIIQFVIFKSVTYCFKKTIGFDVKASFASRP